MPYNNVPHADMIGKTAAVAGALTPALYAYLVSLLPTPQGFGQLCENYQASFAASLKGDPEKVKECEADREALNQAIAILFGLGKAANRQDPTILDKLALNHIAERSAVATTAVGNPMDYRLMFDKNGKPYATLARLSSAKGYEIWACDGDPSVESNWNFLVWSTSCKKIPLAGLNRSKANFLRIRGKRADIVGPWSHFIKLDPA